MQNYDTLITLFKHHLWANLRLVEQCKTLTSEQLDKSIPGSYGSIYITLHHIATAEQSYFSRISTGQRYDRPADAPQMTLDEIMENLRKTGEGLIEWAPKVQPEDTVVIEWKGTPTDVPKTIILTQVINHANEHREQIKAIISELGIEPQDLQSWVYFDEVYIEGI